MDNTKQELQTAGFIPLITVALLTITAFATLQLFQVEGSSPSPIATYSHGLLHLSIPYHAAHAGTGRLKMEVLDPEDQVLGSAERQMKVSAGHGRWQEPGLPGEVSSYISGLRIFRHDLTPCRSSMLTVG
jgi:hypothetical protein